MAPVVLIIIAIIKFNHLGTFSNSTNKRYPGKSSVLRAKAKFFLSFANDPTLEYLLDNGGSALVKEQSR